MSLFHPYRLGSLELANRIVMAPMTRSRAAGNVPGEMMRDYYAQRASAGLIITEGVAPSADGLGYCRIPGLFSPEQVAGWRLVTEAVHAAGGRIFAQLMHTGRIGHPLNLPAGARLLAPSAVQAGGMMYTDQQGPQPHPTPEAMSAADVAAARDAYVQASRNAIAAGFDGIELHGANGYLIEQFLNPHSNQRTDAYGGSVANRIRFAIETAQAAVEAIGAERVAIRLSPHNTYNDLAAYDETREQYTALASALKGLAFVHVVNNPHEGFAGTLAAIRAGFGGPLIRNGGFTRESAEQALAEGSAELISFGRPFIANPDLVARMKSGAPLATPRPELFFSPGREGYLDYPTL